MLPDSLLSSSIHRGLDRSVHERFLSRLSGLQNRGHHSRAEYHGKQTGGEGSTAMEENTDQDRNAGDGKTDHRDMVEGQVDVGGGEELGHMI
jgi:hypothetical protein